MKKMLLLLLSLMAVTYVKAAQTDSLREYRPRVWWHWMNGNITHEGIRKDIEWMDKSGIAGFHLFDAGFNVPQIVDDRLVYMSEGWKREFNYALDLADSLGMEVSITSSPGWSITGGPWVSKDDAMKKLVWSETVVRGGISYRDTLAKPASTCGFYQSLLQYPKEAHKYDYYRDVAVIAVKISDADLTMDEMGAVIGTSDGTDASALTDGELNGTVEVGPGADGYSWVSITFDRPRTIKAYLEGLDSSEKVSQTRRLEYSMDGQNYIPITFRDPETPTLVGVFDIPPTTARCFRFVSNVPGRKLKYTELRLFGVTKVNAATEKAGFFASRSLRDFYPTPQTDDAVSKVIDLSSRYNDGVLDWKVPSGRWRIYRFGYNLTGKRNGPAAPEATGLEVDKLDRDAVIRYYRNYFKMYDEASGGRLGSTISHLMIDSYESRCQNWTARMPVLFESRRGYSLMHWLPALAGEVVESADRTERFLNDWRRTIEELTAQAHYDAADVVLDEYGMKRHTEAHEYSRVYNADGMDVRRNAEIPMASFWMREFYSSYPCEEADMREATSVAHIYGQNVVGSESFTTNGEDPDGYGRRRAWTQHPGNLKSAADAAMASGLTRFIIHSCILQSVEDKIPGLTLGKYGIAFNRHNTWADEVLPWTDYLTRSSCLLSRGRFAADVAVYYSETTNAVARFNYERPLVPEGHAYDFVNRTIITDGVLKLEGNRLVSDSGMSYRILVIDREVKYMSLPVLRRIADFARAGVFIVGERPEKCFGLEEDMDEFRTLVEDVWGKGRFNVVHPSQMDKALAGMAIAPDVSFLNPTGADIRFVHRHLENGEMYWIANINPDYRTLDVSFDVTGLKPRIYHADSDRWEETSFRIENGRTVVTLNLVPDDAQFVLFDEPTSVTSHTGTRQSVLDVFPVDAAWTVSFQEGRGAPKKIRLDRLSGLDESADACVKFFSGTACYSCRFDFSPVEGASGYSLDLGEVHDMAHVFLNGKDLGLVWKEPFSVDASEAVVPGQNNLEVYVTNTWHNRIIGDLQPDVAEPVTYTSYNFYTADSPLRESGLVGPVKMKALGSNAPKIVNFINFVRHDDFREKNSVEALYEATKGEVELAVKYNLPTTFLLQYDALEDPAYQELMRNLPANCEVGGWWEITRPHYEAAGQKWPFEHSWYPYDVLDFGIGHSQEMRERLVDAYMSRFKEVFGYYPKSMGSWYIDSYTLGYMADKYHVVASCVCKEQVGTDGYTLWGGYWNQAFYPSRVNAHMPAQTAEGAIPVPVFRMLGSDPVYQYDDALGHNGQGVCTMEPVYSLGGGKKDWVESFLHTFVTQPCMDFNYVQLGQENSFTWPKIGKALEMQCTVVDSLHRKGLLELRTLSETGKWFSEKFRSTPATAVTVMNDTRGQGKKTLWFDSRFYRANFIWEDEGFRIRDIHKFDENKKSAYHDNAASGRKFVYNSLPVVDGFQWSTGAEKAGLLIRLEDGSAAQLDSPVITEASGVMTVKSLSKTGELFTFVLTEKNMTLSGPGKESWKIDLYVPEYSLVPYTSISSDNVSAFFEGFGYDFSLEKGTFVKGKDKHVLSIIPSDGEIVIDFT